VSSRVSSEAQERKDSGGGLSLATLVIASLSSVAAAIFIHEFWQGGAILGAAITPIIVSIVSELLRKPTETVTTVVAQRRPGTPRTAAAGPAVPTGASRAPTATRTVRDDDPFGLRPERGRRVRRRRLGLAFATGLVAFVVAGFLLTGTELVIGNPLGGSGGASTASDGGGGGTTLLGGGGDGSEDEQQGERQDDQADEQQQDEQQQDPAPDEEQQDPAAPEDGTTPTTPETAPETAPAPDGTTPPGEQAPTPEPTQPDPAQPAPDPGGTPAPTP